MCFCSLNTYFIEKILQTFNTDFLQKLGYPHWPVQDPVMDRNATDVDSLPRPGQRKGTIIQQEKLPYQILLLVKSFTALC